MKQKNEKLLSQFSDCVQHAFIDINIITHKQIFQLLNLLTHQNEDGKYDVSLCTDSTKDLQLKQNQRDVFIVQSRHFEWLFYLMIEHEHVQIWQDCDVLQFKNFLVNFAVTSAFIVLFKKRRQDDQQETLSYIENAIKLDCNMLSNIELHLHIHIHVKWNSDFLDCCDHLLRISVSYLIKHWLLIQWQH